MTQNRKSTRSNSRPGSLLSPVSTGGIAAGKGFDFQTRYAACHLPIWLLENGFHQLFHEGTGDIDIRYKGAEGSFRVHIQVKDHEVGPVEFRGVIKEFQERDGGMPGIYNRFTLVCPSLSKTLRSIETGLARFRNATPFYDDVESALAPTKADLDSRFLKLDLDEAQIEFIHSKVNIDVGHGDLRHDEHALDSFVARLLKHPEYADQIRTVVQPAFAEVLRAIQGKRGAVFERAEIEKVLRAAITTASPGEQTVSLVVQNWTREKFEILPDYELDWSQHFDRNSRRVPSEQIWNMELVPELIALKEKILSERTERVIRLRGKPSLSSGIALGATFPAVGGWVFEIIQPPATAPWRSDVGPTRSYQVQSELIDGDGKDIVLGVSISGDSRNDVLRYIENSATPPRLAAFMTPRPAPSSQSIGGADEARAFALAVREQLIQLVKTHGTERTRLFFYGPFALAVFLGQQLTSVGEIQLFEYQDPGYTPSCKIRT